MVNFLNQNPNIPSWPGVFQLDIFLVLFWVNRCVFLLSDVLRVLLTLLPCCLSIRLFCYVLLVAIFYSKIVRFFLHLVVRMFSYHLSQLESRISFHCFGISCFVCIALPFVDIFLIFISFASNFWFISSSCIVIFSCAAIFFLFQHVPAFLLLSFLPVFVNFFSCISSRISYPDFDFFLRAFWGYLDFLTNLFRSWID